MSGLLFIVAAPSGGGKTTLVRLLLQEEPGVCLSISCTTRLPRPGEQNGREYHFMDEEGFKAKIAAGDFLEWAKVHGNFYGTSKSWIKAERAAGKDVLLEIDWQGAQQVKKVFPEAIGIFILPPSMEILANRLSGRGTDSPDVVKRRLDAAEEEMKHIGEFDYAIINKELAVAAKDLAAIVRSCRLTLKNQYQHCAGLFKCISPKHPPQG